MMPSSRLISSSHKAFIRALASLLTLIVAVCALVGCHKLVGPTEIRVVDPVRHYLPILQGDELRMIWKLYNEGDEPFIIHEIQPACSSIYLEEQAPEIIPVGDSAVLIFRFATEKNVNLTQHSIRIFGNVKPAGEIELRFDVQVVRPSADHSDYEERYFEKMTEEDVAHVRRRGNIYYTDSLSADEIL